MDELLEGCDGCDGCGEAGCGEGCLDGLTGCWPSSTAPGYTAGYVAGSVVDGITDVAAENLVIGTDDHNAPVGHIHVSQLKRMIFKVTMLPGKEHLLETFIGECVERLNIKKISRWTICPRGFHWHTCHVVAWVTPEQRTWLREAIYRFKVAHPNDVKW